MIRKHQLKHQQQTAADIIRRLPLHRQLNASQTMLVKLAPVWRSWVNQLMSEKRLSDDCLQNIQLSSCQQGKLVLACNNSVIASQIKHQQQSLLEALHNQTFAEIKQIIVRIQQPTLSQLDDDKHQQKTKPADYAAPLSVSSLKAIKNMQKTVESDQLANSLRKLAETLKNIKNKDHL